MDGGGREPMEVEEELVMAGEDSGNGGRQSKRLGYDFQGGIAGSYFIWLEMWVLTPCMGWPLGSFPHRVARQIMGRNTKQQEYGGWEYPPPETGVEEAGFE